MAKRESAQLPNGCGPRTLTAGRINSGGGGGRTPAMGEMGDWQRMMTEYQVRVWWRMIEMAAAKAPDVVPALVECCPICGSPAPHLHPAVQEGGEVETCTGDFHLRVTPSNTKEYREMVLVKRAKKLGGKK